jgi:hypothetical protein
MSFIPLHDDAYIESATALLASTSLSISTTALQFADTLLDKARTQQSASEPTVKRRKLQILHHTNHLAIVQHIQEVVVTYTHGATILVLIDLTLQAHRAQNIADATIDLTITPEPPTTVD